MFKVILSALFYFFFSFIIQAQYPNEHSLLKAFELQQKTTNVNNSQKVKNLQPFLKTAAKNHWQNAWVKIQSSKAKLYSDLYQIKDLMNVIHVTLPVAKKLKLIDEITVLESFWLKATIFSNSITTNISAKKLLDKLPKIKSKREKNQVILNLSVYFLNQGDYLTSLRLALDLDDEDLNSRALKAESLADLYFRVGDMGKYNEFSAKAIALFEQLDDLSLKAVAMYNRMTILFINGDFDKIKENLSEFEQAVEAAGDITLLGDLYRFKGMLALHQHKYPLAKSFLNKSKIIYQEHDLEYYVMLSDLVLLETIVAEGDFLKAKGKVTVIKSDVISLGETDEIYSYYHMVTMIHRELNDYKSAFYAAGNLKKYELVLVKENNQSEIIKFEYEQSLKNKQIEKEYMQKQQEQQNIIWSLIVTFVLLTFCFLIFVLYKQVKAKRSLAILANTDALTEAPNRRAVMAFADSACKDKKPLTVIIADIDNFKVLNDTFGHDIGDEVLKSFAKSAGEVMRHSDFFGRIGGEEWLFILPQTELVFTEALFERLSSVFSVSLQDIQTIDIPVTFSMGSAQLDKNESLDSVISRADKKLYEAKKSGRNRTCF